MRGLFSKKSPRRGSDPQKCSCVKLVDEVNLRSRKYDVNSVNPFALTKVKRSKVQLFNLLMVEIVLL